MTTLKKEEAQFESPLFSFMNMGVSSSDATVKICLIEYKTESSCHHFYSRSMMGITRIIFNFREAIQAYLIKCNRIRLSIYKTERLLRLS